MIRFVVSIGVVSVWFLAAMTASALAKDGRGEVRVAGICGGGASSTLRLKGGDDGIELRFEVDRSRARAVWRVVIVHERRIAWRGAATAGRSGGSFEVRRMLRDFPGSDEVTVRALGPRGVVCRAQATLPDS